MQSPLTPIVPLQQVVDKHDLGRQRRCTFLKMRSTDESVIAPLFAINDPMLNSGTAQSNLLPVRLCFVDPGQISS
jgi:hypothetical protein